MCKTLWELPRWCSLGLCPREPHSVWGHVPVGSPLALTSLSDPHFTPPCTPELTVLSTQATERPAKRLATPRATFTSSFRMSSHRLLRNLNNLSVYVATPGERRKERLVDGGPGCRYVSGHLPQVVGAAGRWVISLLKVSTPCSTRSSRQDSSVWGWGALSYFQLREETLRLMQMVIPGLRNYGRSVTASVCLR